MTPKNMPATLVRNTLALCMASCVAISCRKSTEMPIAPQASASSAAVGNGSGTSPCPSAMVLIPGGSRIEEFCIDRLEVSVGNYRTCVEAGVCTPPPDLDMGTYSNLKTRIVEFPEHYPMNLTTWEYAIQYCEWRGLRLPTVEEWFWAARGREERRNYPLGNASRRPESLCTGGFPCAVGTSPEDCTRDGVMDMGGNVQEWTGTSIGGKVYVATGIPFNVHPVPRDPLGRSLLTGFRCATGSSPRDLAREELLDASPCDSELPEIPPERN
jgi:hypothetical protein